MRADAGQPTRWETVLTRDYCPWAERYVRWAATPLGSLVLIAIAAGLCGLILSPHGFVILVGILALIALGLIWPWLGVPGLWGSLMFDRAGAREGETLAVHVTMRNRGRLSNKRIRTEYPSPTDLGTRV